MRLAMMGVVLVATSMYGCGGGGGDNGGGGGNNLLGQVPSRSDYVAGIFKPESTYADSCASPTSSNEKKGTTTDEKNFLRSWTNDTYLWYSEVPDLDPGTATSVADYFDELKTTALTPSEQKKDRFHFTYSTADWIALSQSGVQAGYGFQVALLQSAPPRDIEIAYTDPNTPAQSAGVSRGDKVVAVDGADAINGATQAIVDKLNAGLFPDNAGEQHTFTLQALNGSQRTITLTSADVTSTPVQHVQSIDTQLGKVGYIQFNDHIETSEDQLVSAFTQLKQQNVTDLVLDIRYNGGGLLDIASEVAYMIAGPTQTAGRTFELTHFNDKHPSTDPVTGRAIAPTPFHTTTQGFGGTDGVALPTLNLNRVYLLTGPDTCSASESIINSLRGVDVQVYEIGSTTCGKPYGFYPQPNCGTTYFSIQFEGTNDKGFGNYPDGFSPSAVDDGGAAVAGCSVDDDFAHALGDATERVLAAALTFRASNNQTCPAATGTSGQTVLSKPAGLAQTGPLLRKSPLLMNRIMRVRTS
jgi:carboxyl-terminal processing protease